MEARDKYLKLRDKYYLAYSYGESTYQQYKKRMLMLKRHYVRLVVVLLCLFVCVPNVYAGSLGKRVDRFERTFYSMNLKIRIMYRMLSELYLKEKSEEEYKHIIKSEREFSEHLLLEDIK